METPFPCGGLLLCLRKLSGFVGQTPRFHGLDNGLYGLAQRAEGILHPGRNFRIDRAHHKAVRFHRAQTVGRHFLADAVQTLQQILQAGLYAPSAGGRQGVIFAVSQNPEVNERLGKIKRANSHPRTATATSYVSREQPSIADDPKLINAFYDAPAVCSKRFSVFGGGLRRCRRKHDAGGGCAGDWLLLGYPRPGDAHPQAKPRNNDRVLRF